MERINWHFNSDFEYQLLSGKPVQYVSSKSTQEFEYFINFLNPLESIYTKKEYGKEFLDFFQRFTSHSFLKTSRYENVEPWCQSYEKLDLIKKFQSKEVLLHFKKLDLVKHELSLIDSVRDLEAGYLYKRLFAMGGMGHFEYPLHQKKIETLLQKEVLIKEEKLNRTRDFSTLFDNHNMIGLYENSIDQYYQFKGSLIGEMSLADFSAPYNKALAQIIHELREYKGVYSVDSFLYEKEGQYFLQPISEINMRKTMGYFALKLKEKYFADFPWGKLLLIKNNRAINYQNLHNHFGEKVFLISPLNNLFYVFFIPSFSREEIESLESQLLATFF